MNKEIDKVFSVGQDAGSAFKLASQVHLLKTSTIECVQKILADPDSPDVPRLEVEIDRLVYELYGNLWGRV